MWDLYFYILQFSSTISFYACAFCFRLIFNGVRRKDSSKSNHRHSKFGIYIVNNSSFWTCPKNGLSVSKAVLFCSQAHQAFSKKSPWRPVSFPESTLLCPAERARCRWPKRSRPLETRLHEDSLAQRSLRRLIAMETYPMIELTLLCLSHTSKP